MVESWVHAANFDGHMKSMRLASSHLGNKKQYGMRLEIAQPSLCTLFVKTNAI